MPQRFRVALAALLIVGLACLAAYSWWTADTPAPTAPGRSTAMMTNDDCQRCHQAVWDEWQTSTHSESWTSPHVQAAFQHFGHDRKCESCHAPEPVFVTGIDNPPELRADNRQAGVDCLSCHLGEEGRVVAARTIDDAPCRPLASPELQSSRQCAGCHVAIYEDWQASTFASENKTCQTCHMPTVPERDGGASHLCLGGHDDATVRKAVRVSCQVGEDELVVTVQNHGAGHNFPGERHNRVLLVELFEYSEADTIVLGRQHVIKDITPFRGESSSEQIRAGESAVIPFPVAAGAVRGEVRLLYKRFPWVADRDALVVDRQEVVFE